MSGFTKVFPNRHTVLPVVHAESASQALRNTQIARDVGADGVFLINHSISHHELLRIHDHVHARFPDWWVGVNCLDLEPDEAFRFVSEQVAGVWADNACIDELSDRQPAADRISAARKQSGWNGLYFGGVAFKYQRHVDDLATAAAIASRYMDVVTTSGPGTGRAAGHQKIVTLKQALGNFPLAIASGITPENVGDYLDVADCFLVATGISNSFTELDPARVRALVERVSSEQGSF